METKMNHALAAKRSLLTLLCIFALSINSASLYANQVTIPDPESGTTITTTTYLPIAINTNTSYTSCGAHSVSQQLYYASELEGASSNTIEAITFYYQSGTNFDGDYARKLQVWMSMTSITNFDTENGSNTPHMVSPGTKVFSGPVELKSDSKGQNGKPYTITFDTPFEWNGTSNIIVTVQDTTGLKNTQSNYGGWEYERTAAPGATSMFADEGKVRFLHKTCTTEVASSSKGWNINSLTDALATSSTAANRKYVNKITFTFAAAPETPPSTPEDLAVSNVGATTANLSWTAVDGAESYKLLYSTDGTVFVQFATPSTNSYSWSGLTANTTYYVQVAAVNAAGTSDYSEAESFTTLAPHIHDGITFEPWSNPSAMPTSGNYYLATDVAFGWESSDVTLTGDLNLCLNGHEANLAFFKIVVPDDKTLAIYDNVGGGKITGFVASEVGAFDIYAKALIVVYNGAELDLHQGIIENTYIPDEDGQSYAIYSNGTLRLSGDVLINSNSADIYLYSSNIITLAGAINNSEKHTVYKNGGAFTTGWSTHMSGEDPRDYFESANSARSVCLDGGEASLRLLLNLSESNLNNSIGTSSGQVADVNLTRSLTSLQYNTFCLPFALDGDQLTDIFGSGYDLEELTSSSLNGDLLDLEFTSRTALEAGKPYLLKPASDVANPSFEGVTIAATSPVDINTTYINFKGVYAPTELEGGNYNLLFLGEGNELFWPETTGNLKGFRAYFEVTGGAPAIARRARIVKQENTATGTENQKSEIINHKYIKDGHLLILRDNKTYNVLGLECK